MPGHRRTEDPIDCQEEHERVEDQVTKKLMNKMTIRVGIIMFGSIAIITGIMNWVALGQVEHHENEEHKALITDTKMDAEHIIIEKRIAEDIEDVADQVGDLQDEVSDMKEQMHLNYNSIIDEIRKIPTGTP